MINKAVDRSLDIYLKAILGEGETQNESQKSLKIGALAGITGEANSIIRHWTKEGLLDVSEITASGYQLYSSEMVARIKKSMN
ncbi:MAG: MerR family transcriptional regulator [Candidatus Paracaedibacter sp.]